MAPLGYAGFTILLLPSVMNTIVGVKYLKQWGVFMRQLSNDQYLFHLLFTSNGVTEHGYATRSWYKLSIQQPLCQNA